jgi:reverse transcriptase-like protein
MPMGFKNASSIFQRAIEDALAGLVEKACMVYIDDIIVFGRDDKEHDRNLRSVLTRLEEMGLKANPAKFVHNRGEVAYCGHYIAHDNVRPRFNARHPIENYPVPKNKTNIQEFMGLVNQYQKFIPGCAQTTEPLTRLLKKDQRFAWGQEQQDAFDRIREDMQSDKVLRLPDFDRRFTVYGDASDVTGTAPI